MKYPNTTLWSKNILSKRLSSKYDDPKKIREKINKCYKNKDLYWNDLLSQSKPEKNKYVRNARGTDLGWILNRVDKKILARLDQFVPSFLHGGLTKKGTITACLSLLGTKRKRYMLSMDLKTFYEQISDDRVKKLFYKRFGNDEHVSEVLTYLCTVPLGRKGSKGKKSIGRGFSTSSRLSIWCCMPFFNELNVLVHKELKGHDPVMAVYVDDIKITASRVDENKLKALSLKVEKLALKHSLKINHEKTSVSKYDLTGLIGLGITLGRNGLRESPRLHAMRVVTKKKMGEAKKRKDWKSYKKLKSSYVGRVILKNLLKKKTFEYKQERGFSAKNKSKDTS